MDDDDDQIGGNTLGATDPFQSLANQSFSPNDDPGFFSDVFNGVMDGIEDIIYPGQNNPILDSSGNVIQGASSSVLGQALNSVGNAVDDIAGVADGDSGFPLWGYAILILVILLVGAYITREVVG